MRTSFILTLTDVLIKYTLQKPFCDQFECFFYVVNVGIVFILFRTSYSPSLPQTQRRKVQTNLRWNKSYKGEFSQLGARRGWQPLYKTARVCRGNVACALRGFSIKVIYLFIHFYWLSNNFAYYCVYKLVQECVIGYKVDIKGEDYYSFHKCHCKAKIHFLILYQQHEIKTQIFISAYIQLFSDSFLYGNVTCILNSICVQIKVQQVFQQYSYRVWGSRWSLQLCLRELLPQYNSYTYAIHPIVG